MARLQLLRLKCDQQANPGETGDPIRLYHQGGDGGPRARLWGRQTPGFRTGDPSVSLGIAPIEFTGTVPLELVEMHHEQTLGTVTLPNGSDECTSDGIRLARFVARAPAHYTLAYRVEGAGATGSVAEEDDCLACMELPLDECEPPRTAARGESPDFQHMVLQCSDTDHQRWPRYVVKVSQPTGLALYHPTATPQLRRLTRRDEERWYSACYPSPRDITDDSTWGPPLPIHVPCCRLDHSGDLARLVRGGGTWDWVVFGWTNVSPGWNDYLVRTLAMFPREQLEFTGIHTLIFDLRVNSYYLAPTRLTVGSGGTNWLRTVWQRGTPAPPADRRPALLVAYASLNKPWYSPGGGRPRATSEAEIDDSYSPANHRADLGRVIGTIYHEFGHVFHPPGHAAGAGEWTPPLPAPDAVTNLWSRYRDSISYGGKSMGADEGFGQACANRMSGRPAGYTPLNANSSPEARAYHAAGGGDISRTVDSYLDTGLKIPINRVQRLAMPSRESVRQVQRELADSPISPASCGLPARA